MVLSRDVKVLRIHPDKSAHFFTQNMYVDVKKQFLDMVIPKSITFSDGLIMSRLELYYGSEVIYNFMFH